MNTPHTRFPSTKLFCTAPSTNHISQIHFTLFHGYFTAPKKCENQYNCMLNSMFTAISRPQISRPVMAFHGLVQFCTASSEQFRNGPEQHISVPHGISWPTTTFIQFRTVPQHSEAVQLVPHGISRHTTASIQFGTVPQHSKAVQLVLHDSIHCNCLTLHYCS